MYIDEKAGIIKSKRPVIVGPKAPLELFQNKAKELDSPFFYVEADNDTNKDFEIENQKITR